MPESLVLPTISRLQLHAILLAIALLLAGNQFAIGQDKQAAGQLAWKNGDKVPGRIVSADRSRLQWHAENLFRDPLDLDLMFLDRIEFKQTAAPAKTAETYSIQMIDGFSLFGQITKLDDKHLSVSSPRFGDIQVDRDRIAAILNLKNSGSLINGEFDLSRWDSDRGEKKHWSVNDQGQLQSQRQNIHLFFKNKLPETALVEVEFQWQKKLDFIFGFGVPRNTRNVESLPRLESWDDSIVLSHGDDFDIVIESIDQESKRLKLLIHWNQNTGAIVIHDELGKQLAIAELRKPPRSIEPGIFIENKSGDLTVDSLMIRKSSAGFDATRPSVQAIDEATRNGAVESFDGTAWTLRLADDPESPASIPAAQFCGAFLVNPSLPRPTGKTRIRFFDGMYLAGELVSIEDGKLTLQPTFTSEPVEFSLTGMAALRFDTPLPTADAESFSHKLFNEAGEIQGRLEEGSGAADDILRWRVTGAASAVPFSQGNARIALQPNQPVIDRSGQWSDTLYLTNRDTIPCRVVGIDGTHVTVDSFAENKRIDASLIKAIDMRIEDRSESVEPSDAQWMIAEDAKKLVDAKDGKFKLKAKARIGHPSLFSSGGFGFELGLPGSYGVLECQLLASDVATGEGGQKISIMMYEKNLYVGESGNVNPGVNGKEIPTNGQAKITFKFEKGDLLVLVDGRKVHTVKVSGEKSFGRGVVFGLNDIYQQGFTCTMTNFRRDVSGFAGNTFVDPGRRELLLTIPRLLKNRPPKQILGATNGDLLRGELVSLDESRIVFRSNNDDKTFPCSVVSSIVWLHAEKLAQEAAEAEKVAGAGDQQEIAVGGEKTAEIPDMTAGASGETSGTQTVQVLMHGGRRMTSTLRSWTDGKLTGESPALGTCHIPFEQISELRFGSYATEATDVPYADWVAHLAPAPRMETGADGNVGSEMLFGSASPLIGTIPASFSVKLLDGSTFSLKDQTGKVVVLDFWATWCGPCVQALPGISKVISNYPPDQVAFVAVNQEESADTIIAFLKSRDLEIPVALDDGKLGQQFAVEAIPQAVIIDRVGKIAFVNVGISANLDERLTAAIDHLLNPVVTEMTNQK